MLEGIGWDWKNHEEEELKEIDDRIHGADMYLQWMQRMQVQVQSGASSSGGERPD